MPKPYTRLVALFILFLQTGIAQDFLFNVRHLTVEDGLLGRQVNAIIQDRQGFIWIGTFEGLNRFDGYEFQQFTPDTIGQSNYDTQNLELDDEGYLWVWVETRNKVHLLHTTTFEFQSLKDKFEDELPFPYSNVWDIGNTGSEIVLRTSVGYFKYNHSTLEPLTSTHELGLPYLGDFREKDTTTGVIRYYSKVGSPFPTIHIPGFVVTQLAEVTETYTLAILESDRTTLQYLAKISSDGRQYEIIDSTTLTSTLFCNKLLFFDNKVYIPQPEQLLSFDLSNYITTKPTFLYQDQSSTIWIGTRNGVFLAQYRPNPFKMYFKDALHNGSLYEAGGIWANHEFLYSYAPQKSLRWNFAEHTATALHEELDYQFYTVSSHAEHGVWVGGDAPFIMKIDTLTGKAVDYIPIEDPSKIGITIFNSHSSGWWLGGIRGLQYYSPDSSAGFQVYKKNAKFGNILQRGAVYHISEARGHPDFLWLSTQSGWYLLHTKNGIQQRYWTQAPGPYAIPPDVVFFTHQDKDGVYWLTTMSHGLVRVELSDELEVKNVQEFTTQDGLPSNRLYAIVEDEDGYLWLSTHNGICRFHKTTRDVQVFNEEDGLPHYEFNGASFQRRDGEIFFGTVNGIVSFHPKDFRAIKPYDAPLSISSCQKYSRKKDRIIDVTRSVLKQAKIILRPNDQFFTLAVTLQDYFNSPKLQYAYKIEGFQSSFNLTKENKISISGLPYGNYTLHIKGKSKDNRFSTAELRIPIVVIRPVYLRWWFIALQGVIAGVAIWQLILRRTRALQQRKEELEQVVLERTAQLNEQANLLQRDKATIEAQAEELRSLDEMKSRFFANISHELRTPLTLILGPVHSLLKRNTLDRQEITYLTTIQQNAYSLLKRINEILDLTKLEVREMELNPLPTPFYIFTKRLAATFESLTQQKEQLLTFHYKLDKRLQILLDQDKFGHIFNNLLSNAIKYTPPRGEIEIRIYQHSPSSQHLVLEVKDTGPGIHPEDLPRVFDRFYQARHAENKAGGSGIGLALVREIAHAMNGKVYASTTVGQGSAFYFELPYEEVVGDVKQDEAMALHPDYIVEELLPLPVKAVDPNKPTILLVEDNIQLRNYLQLILQENYNILPAENGQDALHKLSDLSAIHLIISDIMMPVLDGFELLNILKSSDAWRHLPVIMLTARSSIADKLQALRIGVDDYLLKPFREEELLARVSNLLKNVRNRQPEAKTVAVEETEQESSPVEAISQDDLNWLQRVEQILQKEISNPNFTIDHLSHELFISHRQLHRRIKKITGLTPNLYFREIKLEFARKLLESGNVQTVVEIAYTLGFSTPAYFSKLYSERFGKRPVDYF